MKSLSKERINHINYKIKRFFRRLIGIGKYSGSESIEMSADEKYEKEFKKTSMHTAIAGAVLSVGAGYYFGSEYPDKPLKFFYNIKHMDWSVFLCVFVVVIVVTACIFLISLNKYYRDKGSRRGREHGSSRLMRLSDMKSFRQGFFFDPKVVRSIPKYEDNGKDTFFNDIELKTMLKDTIDLERDIRKNPIKPIVNSGQAKIAMDSANFRCFMNSQIMAQDIYVSMNAKFINRNLNTITIGGSGQGKSFSELFPNIMTANANYVITDPSGEILQKCGRFLMNKGYAIKVFNIKDFDMSMRYNPLMYIESEADINIAVDALNKNIDGAQGKSSSSGDFFEKAQISLTAALFSALRELYPDNPEKQTLFNVMELLRMAEQKKDPATGEQFSELDRLFDELKRKNPRSYAVKMYENFKVGGPKVCGSVIISATAVFGRFFDNDSMARLVEADDLNLYDFATGVDEDGNPLKCALFLVIPQDTSTYNFLVSMIYSQLFSIVTKGGEKWRMQHNTDNPALPRHLSFWLDEFANCGRIPNFLEVLSVVRKYNISINIIIQALSQLKSNYKDEWETILGNVDTMIYLGGQEASTIKMMAEKLGKETIKTHSLSKSGKGSTSSVQTTARDVMTAAEIEQISRAYELVFITGLKPFKAKKYNLTQHPNYTLFGEADPEKNNLNISEFKFIKDDDVLDDKFREIPAWHDTGRTDEYGVSIKKLYAKKEELLTKRKRIKRIDENTLDMADIMAAVEHVDEIIYSLEKKIRFALSDWERTIDIKSKNDKLMSEAEAAFNSQKSTRSELEKAEKAFKKACDDEYKAHIRYLTYMLKDIRERLENEELSKAEASNLLAREKELLDEMDMLKATASDEPKRETVGITEDEKDEKKQKREQVQEINQDDGYELTEDGIILNRK